MSREVIAGLEVRDLVSPLLKTAADLLALAPVDRLHMPALTAAAVTSRTAYADGRLVVALMPSAAFMDWLSRLAFEARESAARR